MLSRLSTLKKKFFFFTREVLGVEVFSRLSILKKKTLFFTREVLSVITTVKSGKSIFFIYSRGVTPFELGVNAFQRQICPQ